ncbi:FAD-binding molybdopterin dehydrogenase [Methylopila jiangsuensis]|uniref:FAD-binding molybdopterin dehydrogenase n=1 Tax=Methylopila jiangsuensis TaxID=586230 RepID=A0A9W6JG38_9HYPH|nr:FAD binding domain-containing protein [Methylopila jiangsuensis]MDR6285487.1 CO/xanthine dehydrogenase FAD-binding subunit [Methylopila jiangsuensis]GLK75245.1 FAD-binding molybdopterin dehydrogenase [Methylopila jiangsuensis]
MDLNAVEQVIAPSVRAELPPWRAGDAFLAGGTWLFSEPQPELRRLVDLAALRWPPFAVTPEGLILSATCTLAELDRIEAPADWRAMSVIAPCRAALVGSFKVWAQATVGGNLCLALPAAPMAALAAALDGDCRVWAPDGAERTIPARAFILGPRRTALSEGEALREIRFPVQALKRRAALRRASLSPLGRSAALLIGTLDETSGAFALTVAAATPRPLRLDFARVPAALDLREALEGAAEAVGWHGDVHGAPAWRRHMTLLLAEEIRAGFGAAA